MFQCHHFGVVVLRVLAARFGSLGFPVLQFDQGPLYGSLPGPPHYGP